MANKQVKVDIHIFKSEPKKSFFAPEYDYRIFETEVQQVNFIDLAKLILSKEKELLELPISDVAKDAYTGLGPDSTTARFDKYNVLKWKDKNIEELKGNIIHFHNNILKYFKQPIPKELYVQCWANIMRKGDQIKTHIHDIGPNCYLAGHICVQCDDTYTHYINPINQINNPMTHSSKNDVGKMSMFPKNIQHYKDIQKSNNERITLAFDLFPFNPETIKDGNLHSGNYLKIV